MRTDGSVSIRRRGGGGCGGTGGGVTLWGGGGGMRILGVWPRFKHNAEVGGYCKG